MTATATTLITAEHAADMADRVTFLPRQAVLVKGLYNQVLVRDVHDLEQARTALLAIGLAPRRAWDAGLNGAHSVDVVRTS